MQDGRPVARLVAPVINRVSVIVALLAAIAMTGVVVWNESVQTLTDELHPAVSAHQETLQDMSDMQSAVRVWARTELPYSQDDFREARASLDDDWAVVVDFAADDPELARLVDREAELATAWTEEFAIPRLQDPGGPDTYDPDRFQRGEDLFDAYRAASDRTADALADRLQAARDRAGLRLRATIATVILVAALGAWATYRARRRLLEDLVHPLDELEQVVQRMTASDRDVRARATGPREVRAVAAALNELADAQARASAVEEKIQHELRSLDNAKDDFVANVSHELRTPLTTISGYLELVAEEFEGRMQPRHEKMVDAARRNVSRLRLLIDDLLTLSRAENRATDTERVDLGLIVRDAVTDVRMTAARRDIRIDLSIPAGPQLVLGDRAMLHRALLNVLSNAVKFSHDGGSVELTVRLDGEQWVVDTRDHGIGIPQSEIERLGTRFFRATNAVTHEIAGTGLGVRIVQTIVDKHAGELRIDSAEGEGTLVSIRLPAQAGAPDQAPAATASETGRVGHDAGELRAAGTAPRSETSTVTAPD